MKPEDEILLKQYGRKRPFKVPDGYFESVHLLVMETLPDVEPCVITPQPSFWQRYKYVVAVAASVCVLVTGTVARFCIQPSETDTFCSNTVSNSSSFSSVDDAADYLMMDNNDIYAMMSDY